MSRNSRAGLAQSLADLAEKPGEDAPEWHHVAYELRTKRLWSVQRIADVMNRPYRQVYKALHRERIRRTDAASDRRNRAYRTRQDLAYRRQRSPRCERCGMPMNRPEVKDTVCRTCKGELAARRNEVLAELYRKGWSFPDMAEALEMSPESVGATLSNLRKQGWDLPYRRPPRGASVRSEGDEGDYAVRGASRVPSPSIR